MAARRHQGGDLLRTRQIRINAMDQPGFTELPGAFSSDSAAPYDTYVQSSFPQVRPRSLGTMRRNV
jgi:hypothetical protein